MEQEEIGKRIMRLRKSKNLTQEQLAEFLGISGKAVSKWERGINLPDISLLPLIASQFQIGISELLTGKAEAITVEKNKKAKWYIMFLIFIIILLFLWIIYFYSSFHVFNVKSNDSNFIVDGYIFLNPKQNILIINNIQSINDKSNKYMKILGVKVIEPNSRKTLFSYKNAAVNTNDYNLNLKTKNELDEISIYVDNFNSNNLACGKINTLNLEIEFIDLNKNINLHTIELLIENP